jgi:formylglycine-generating enzyme required for sulfatase activity
VGLWSFIGAALLGGCTGPGGGPPPGGGTDTHLDTGTTTTDSGGGVRGATVTIEQGTFEMGCTFLSLKCENNEWPIHTVTLTHGFDLGVAEVTQAEFEAVMGYQPAYFVDCVHCPVERVSWHQAAAFANALSAEDGLEPCFSCSESDEGIECEPIVDPYECAGWRLPTEAEWEYAARAGQDTWYAGSDNADDVAWTLSNSDEKSHPVAQLQPNAWGLYDMSGNVSEWTWDWFGAYEFPATSATDPSGPDSGIRRTRRGGGWCCSAQQARVSRRDEYFPELYQRWIGFRVARSIP